MKIILSLFDGMSCGQLALQRAGISVDYYLASEVDQYAMTVAKKNFPETEHIGDVRELDGTSMVSPFILMGGSPCQSFSFAGKRKGMATEQGEEITTLERYLELKKEGFQFSGQSYLFWEYVRILRETKPKYFLLENVKMAKKWEGVISETLGVRSILINSNLVSFQNRPRLYWTNIPEVTLPRDKGLVFPFGVALTETRTEEAKRIRKEYRRQFGRDFSPRRGKELVARRDGKINCLTATFPTKESYIRHEDGTQRILTVEECEKGQTLPVGYTEGVSNSQRYKMIGNGWTVDVIAHILSHIPEEEK